MERVARWLFLLHFWPLLMLATFLGGLVLFNCFSSIIDKKYLSYSWYVLSHKWTSTQYDNTQKFCFHIYAEVEILIASNLGLIRWLAMLMCFILHLFKITHKMWRFDDVPLFSIKSKVLKITIITWKENSFEFYLFTAMHMLD